MPIMVHLGFGNALPLDRLTVVASFNSRPTKKAVRQARKDNKLIDLTHGGRIRAVLFTTSGHIVLTTIDSLTIARRINDAQKTNEHQGATFDARGIIAHLESPPPA